MADPPGATSTEVDPPAEPDKETPAPASRRTFVKAALFGGAGAAVVGAAFLSQAPTGPSIASRPPYGSQLVWLDKGAGLFRRKDLSTGKDEFASPSPGTVVQDAIDTLTQPVGGEIWLTNDVNAQDAVVTINKNNVSLIALRDSPPRYYLDPRPHIQKLLYTGDVFGGLVQGLHCREIQFDGTGNQELMAFRDISMHPTSTADQRGLRFLGGVGYIQYIEFHNLKIVMSGNGDDYSAIEFGNSNGGSGHIIFSGITALETEHDAAGSPIVIKISSGAETGTPIRFENLSIVDLPVRTAGAPLRPIVLQSQPALSKGLRQMHIDRLFFEQHYASPHSIVTIERTVSPAACWFNLTIDELVLSDEEGKTIHLIDNRNTSWMGREQYLRINSGLKSGIGTVTLGNANPHEHFRVYVENISGLTPFGKLASPFFAGTPMSFVGVGGTSATPTADDYVVGTTSLVVTSTAPWILKDPAGAPIETVPAGQSRSVPVSYRVQFPAGTPTVYA